MIFLSRKSFYISDCLKMSTEYKHSQKQLFSWSNLEVEYQLAQDRCWRRDADDIGEGEEVVKGKTIPPQPPPPQKIFNLLKKKLFFNHSVCSSLVGCALGTKNAIETSTCSPTALKSSQCIRVVFPFVSSFLQSWVNSTSSSFPLIQVSFVCNVVFYCLYTTSASHLLLISLNLYYSVCHLCSAVSSLQQS